mmetsp:Transcript_26335/g.39896  ORF Transcript_26335/g.39896 Transcript_26335/m.39896 type:complete len:81 (-) Transcript_26335:967-1209(-)
MQLEPSSTIRISTHITIGDATPSFNGPSKTVQDQKLGKPGDPSSTDNLHNQFETPASSYYDKNLELGYNQLSAPNNGTLY